MKNRMIVKFKANLPSGSTILYAGHSAKVSLAAGISPISLACLVVSYFLLESALIAEIAESINNN